MELKVWVEGIQRIVCGVTETTTCQDVVYALAHATGKTGRFTLTERWRNNERLLSPQDYPLKILLKWGEYASDVQFILQRTALDQRNVSDSNSSQIQMNRAIQSKFSANEPQFVTSAAGGVAAAADLIPQTSPHKDIRKSLTFSGAHTSPLSSFSREGSYISTTKVGHSQPMEFFVSQPNASGQNSTFQDVHKDKNQSQQKSHPHILNHPSSINRPPAPPPYEVVRGHPPPPPLSHSAHVAVKASPTKSQAYHSFPILPNGSSLKGMPYSCSRLTSPYSAQSKGLTGTSCRPSGLMVQHDRPRKLPPYRDPPPPPPPSHPALLKITSQSNQAFLRDSNSMVTQSNCSSIQEDTPSNCHFKAPIGMTGKANMYMRQEENMQSMDQYQGNSSLTAEENQSKPCPPAKVQLLSQKFGPSLSHNNSDNSACDVTSFFTTCQAKFDNCSKESKEKTSVDQLKDKDKAPVVSSLHEGSQLDYGRDVAATLNGEAQFRDDGQNMLPTPSLSEESAKTNSLVSEDNLNNVFSPTQPYSALAENEDQGEDIFSFSKDLDKSLVKELLQELTKNSVKDESLALGTFDQCMEEVVIDGYYRDLVQLVNLQREKLNFQQVELTKYEAEISYLEGHEKEEESRLLFLRSEIQRLEKEETLQRSEGNVSEEAISHMKKGNDPLRQDIESKKKALNDYKNQIAVLNAQARKLEESVAGEEQECLKAKALNEREQEAITREIDKLEIAIQQALHQSETTDSICQDMEVELSEVETSLKEKYADIELFRIALREANLEALTLTFPEETKSSEGHGRLGRSRRMLGSPRQLENAVPTSKNPHGVWV